MSTSPNRRETFADEALDAPARRLLDVLLAQDGSTTRVCEAIAGGRISLHVARQGVTADVPAPVRRALPCAQYLERYSTLAAHGQVLMDNLTFIALDGLDPAVHAGLEAGTAPIGHLLESLWTRRQRLPRADLDVLGPLLWNEFGLPDPVASRAYLINTPEGPRFLIAETYRRGMRMIAAPGHAARSAA